MAQSLVMVFVGARCPLCLGCHPHVQRGQQAWRWGLLAFPLTVL